MPSNNRRTSEQRLSSPTRRAKASRGSASETVAKKSGVRRTKTGDSQSPEIALRVAQIEATAQAAYTLAEEALRIILHVSGALSRHMRFKGQDRRTEANIDEHMKSATYALAKWREQLDAKIAALIQEDLTKRGGR